MRYSAYSTLNGTCSALIGVLFIVAGFPGLFAEDTSELGYWWLAFPAVGLVLSGLALLAGRRGIPLSQPGRWLTDRPLAAAKAAQSVLPAGPLRGRLITETVVWALIALAVIVGSTSSRPFAYATGWASLAYGLLEILASAPRIRAAEAEQDTAFLIHRRPGLGTPEITTR